MVASYKASGKALDSSAMRYSYKSKEMTLPELKTAFTNGKEFMRSQPRSSLLILDFSGLERRSSSQPILSKLKSHARQWR